MFYFHKVGRCALCYMYKQKLISSKHENLTWYLCLQIGYLTLYIYDHCLLHHMHNIIRLYLFSSIDWCPPESFTSITWGHPHYIYQQRFLFSTNWYSEVCMRFTSNRLDTYVILHIITIYYHLSNMYMYLYLSFRKKIAPRNLSILCYEYKQM